MIPKTIASLIEQTYKNFEIIVVDDGSTDDTKEAIGSIQDNRLKYFKTENAERGAARNYGISKASGNYINYFDSDDLAYPGHLQIAADTIQKNNFPEFIHLGYDFKDEQGKVLARINRFNGKVARYAVKKKMIGMMSMFIRRDIAEQFPFSEDRDFVMGEDALHLCQLAARFKFYYDNTITTSVIQHPQRSMNTNDEALLLYCRDRLIHDLQNDDIFMKKFGQYIPQIGNEYYCLIWISKLKQSDNKSAWKYFKLYTKADPENIFNKRTLIFFKNYIHNLFT